MPDLKLSNKDTKATQYPLSTGVLVAILAAYTLGFVIVLINIGVGEASRRFLAEGVILAFWLWVAHKMLNTTPVETLHIKHPSLELGIGLAGLAITTLLIIAVYSGATWLSWSLRLIDYGIPVAIFLLLGYGSSAIGLSVASRRAWIALFAIVVINLVIGILGGQFLPPGELPTPPGADMAESIHGPFDIMVLLGQILFNAAIPEELYLRVYLQPRLARYVPLSWAIFIQAILFAAIHLPRDILRLGYSWPLALASLFSLSNGVIGGYFWSKTRSLPVLIVLHLFAYSRIGL